MIAEAMRIEAPLVLDTQAVQPEVRADALGLQRDETFKRLNLWRIRTREAYHGDPFVQYATIDDPSVYDRFRAEKARCVRGEGPYRPIALQERLSELLKTLQDGPETRTPQPAGPAG
jgi:hypothetical protein